MEDNGCINDAGSNITVENRLDEIIPEEAHSDSYEYTDDKANQTVTRSGRISKPHSYTTHFQMQIMRS